MAKRRLRHTDTLDPWLIVCERCPLEDCVRPEGSYQKLAEDAYREGHPVRSCPVMQAELNGWQPEEVGRYVELLPAGEM